MLSSSSGTKPLLLWATSGFTFGFRRSTQSICAKINMVYGIWFMVIHPIMWGSKRNGYTIYESLSMDWWSSPNVGIYTIQLWPWHKYLYIYMSSYWYDTDISIIPFLSIAANQEMASFNGTTSIAIALGLPAPWGSVFLLCPPWRQKKMASQAAADIVWWCKLIRLRYIEIVHIFVQSLYVRIYCIVSRWDKTDLEAWAQPAPAFRLPLERLLR